MVYVHATVLGGLPVVADVWFSGPDYYGEYDCGCDGLYWRRKDGSRGAPLSEATMARVEKNEPHWQDYVTEQANDWLGAHCPTHRRNPYYVGFRSGPDLIAALRGDVEPEWIEEGEYSAAYRLLNPRAA